MISLILVLLSGIFKAVMDKLQFHYFDSVFKNLKSSFWNPKVSWINKYKDNDPELGEKFPGSSTIFVWATDAWHLFQSINIILLMLAIVFYESFTGYKILDFIIYRIAYSFTFELFFKFIFSKKN